jgi:SAM-dependent methyltransferase
MSGRTRVSDGPRELEWTPELVDRFWSRLAETRLRELSFGRLNGERLLALVEPYLSPARGHVDFGAGDGDVLRLMLVRGLPPAAYEVAKGRRRRLQATDIARDPSFLGVVGPDSGEVFDVLLMLDVIEHVVDRQLDATFDTIRDLLRPGSVIIVSTPNSEDLELGAAYCPLSDRIFHRWQDVRAFTPDDLADLLAQQGFERILVQRVDFSEHTTLAEKAKWLEARNQALERRFCRGLLRALVESLRKRPLPEPSPGPFRPSVTDLQLGAESHLVYVGRLRLVTP